MKALNYVMSGWRLVLALMAVEVAAAYLTACAVFSREEKKSVTMEIKFVGDAKDSKIRACVADPDDEKSMYCADWADFTRSMLEHMQENRP